MPYSEKKLTEFCLFPDSKIKNTQDFLLWLQESFSFSGQKIKKYKDLCSFKKSKDVFSIPIDLLNEFPNCTYLNNCSLEMPFLHSQEGPFYAFVKPHKTHTLSLLYSQQDSLEVFVRWKYPQLFAEKGGPLYRLDYETYGLILWAKTQEVLFQIRKKFHSSIKRKEYVAIVEDLNQLPNKGILAYCFASSGPKGNKMRPIKGPENSHLSYEKFFYDKKSSRSWIKIFLEEGRRHQIRASFSAAGYPIVGDALYSSKKIGIEEVLQLFCTSYSLMFQEKIFTFSVPLPKQFDVSVE